MTEQHEHHHNTDNQSAKRKMFFILLGPSVVVIIGLFFYLFGDRYISTDNAYVKASKTLISPEVSGKIISVNVKDNSHVTKGEELFAIDPEPFEIAASGAEANLHKVVNTIESLKSSYKQKLADLAKANEDVRFNEHEYKRYQFLSKADAVSKEKRDQAFYAYNTALKARDSATQDAESIKAQLTGNPDIVIEDHPDYKQAKSALEKAKLDLARVKVLAPSDGVVASVTIEPGQYTSVGVPLFALISDSDQWIEANFKETDLTHVKVGQQVSVSVDTYPNIKWKAKVVSITPATGAEFSILPAQNSSGNWVKVVQRIMVRIELEDNADKPRLASGMSTIVEVDTGSNRLQRFFGSE